MRNQQGRSWANSRPERVPTARLSRTGPQPVTPIGEEDREELTAQSLFDPAATKRIVVLWLLTPSLSVVGSYLLFTILL